jgi:hypothetical protein
LRDAPKVSTGAPVTKGKGNPVPHGNYDVSCRRRRGRCLNSRSWLVLMAIAALGAYFDGTAAWRGDRAASVPAAKVADPAGAARVIRIGRAVAAALTRRNDTPRKSSASRD